MAMFYVYLMGFDLLNAIGHCISNLCQSFSPSFRGEVFVVHAELSLVAPQSRAHELLFVHAYLRLRVRNHG